MNATPFFIALLACLWLKEVISKLEIVTMIFAFSGILLVGLSKVDEDDTATGEQPEKEATTISYETSGNLYNIGLMVALGVMLG